MKAHTHYTTPIATTPWVRRHRAVLAASVALVVTAIGLLYTLGFSVPAMLPVADGTDGATTRRLIANCRACRDEALAAQINLAAPPAPAPPVVHRMMRSLISNCRACQDEVLGASQVSLQTADAGQLSLRLDDPRRLGPR